MMGVDIFGMIFCGAFVMLFFVVSIVAVIMPGSTKPSVTRRPLLGPGGWGSNKS